MGEKRGMKALEVWCRRCTQGYRDVNVENMTTAWRDGLAFCALIHHFRPDLIDFDSLSKENVLYNNHLAFTVAEQHLGIPALLDAEDMLKYKVPDKLSILTYVSQWYQYFQNNCSSSMKVPSKRVVPEHTENTIATSPPPDKIPTPASGIRPFVVIDQRCTACDHRVYILERLIVNNRLYHRTCFRCHRCNDVLKPGSYIECDFHSDFKVPAQPSSATESVHVCLRCSKLAKDDDTGTEGNPIPNILTPCVNSEELQYPYVDTNSTDSLKIVAASSAARARFLLTSALTDVVKSEVDSSVREQSDSSQQKMLTDASDVVEESIQLRHRRRSSSENTAQVLSKENDIVKDEVDTPSIPEKTSEIPSEIPVEQHNVPPHSGDVALPPKPPRRQTELSVPKPSPRKSIDPGAVSARWNPSKPLAKPRAKISTPLTAQNQLQEENYPADLNPFGDVDEPNETQPTPCPAPRLIADQNKRRPSYGAALNPFEDDEDEEEPVMRPVTSTPVHSTEKEKNRNPFLSESEEDDSSLRGSMKSPSAAPSRSDDTLSVASFGGTMSRKKRPAPRPPLALSVTESTSPVQSYYSSSAQSSCTNSPRVTPRPSPRPNRKPPPPPPPPGLKKGTPSQISARRSLNMNPVDNSSQSLHTLSATLSEKTQKDLDNLRRARWSAEQKNGVVNKNYSNDTGNSDSRAGSSTFDDQDSYRESEVAPKNTFGYWKKKKPAPPIPVILKRQIQKVPLKEILTELAEIEDKQLELEKQGVEIEMTIREQFSDDVQPTPEEEQLILQLFELVNKKNVLFRQQAELIYIKRQQRLEEEQADIEYQIRCLMEKPDLCPDNKEVAGEDINKIAELAHKKTDEDRVQEDGLINRLVSIVKQRNDIVESMEMDRRREAEEDQSIQSRLALHNAGLHHGSLSSVSSKDSLSASSEKSRSLSFLKHIPSAKAKLKKLRKGRKKKTKSGDGNGQDVGTNDSSLGPESAASDECESSNVSGPSSATPIESSSDKRVSHAGFSPLYSPI